jgi:hypothetical protein
LADTLAVEGTNADLLNLVGVPVISTVASTALSSAEVLAVLTNGAGNEVITYAVTDGLLTIGGTDASKVNTLAEWIRLADTEAATGAVATVAFVFSGNTYVFSQGASDTLIQLTGITTTTGLSTFGDTTSVGDILVG